MHASPFDYHALETMGHTELEFPQESRALVLTSQEEISYSSDNLLPLWSRDWSPNNDGSVIDETTL